jgi:hypothetical protein
MTTYWIDPTLSLMDQQELDLAWNDYWRDMFIIPDGETDSEEEVDFGDEEWEEGPQTPPLGPRPRTWRRLVAIGGGLAMSVDETDSEEDEEWTLSSASSVSTEYRE